MNDFYWPPHTQLGVHSVHAPTVHSQQAALIAHCLHSKYNPHMWWTMRLQDMFHMGILWELLGAARKYGRASTIAAGTSTPADGACSSGWLLRSKSSATMERSPSDSSTPIIGSIAPGTTRRERDSLWMMTYHPTLSGQADKNTCMDGKLGLHDSVSFLHYLVPPPPIQNIVKTLHWSANLVDGLIYGDVHITICLTQWFGPFQTCRTPTKMEQTCTVSNHN